MAESKSHHQTRGGVILAVRHAESVWNALYRQHGQARRWEHPLMYHPDCGITDVGMQQCEKAGKELQDLLAQYVGDEGSLRHPSNDEKAGDATTESSPCTTTTTTTTFPYALVISPLRRALLTAKYMFQHVSYPPSRTLVLPECAEVMVDACDIGSPSDVLAQEFPEYDFGPVQAVEQATSRNWWPHGYDPSVQWDKMRHRQADGSESDAMVAVRMAKLKDMLRSMMASNHDSKKDSAPLVVVMVCHSDVIHWLTKQPTSEKAAEDTTTTTLHADDGGIWADNCQILDLTDYILT